MQDNQEKTIGFNPNKKIDDLNKIIGENHLFLIGISEYKDYPNIKHLPNAKKDVEDFEKILTNKYCFENKNIIRLLNKDATAKAIIENFRKLKTDPEKIKSEDSLIIYFSGHGELDIDFDQGYWVPYDAEKDNIQSYISNENLKTYLDALENKCRHIFLINDSCFSGTLLSPKRSNQTNAVETEPSRYALTSGRGDESVSDGVRGTNSPFAKYLLQILEDSNDSLGVIKLSDGVVLCLSEDRNIYQTPCAAPLDVKGHKNQGQFFFHLRDDEDAVFANSNTIQEINFYLSKYKPAKYRNQAFAKLEQLEKIEMFEEASTTAELQKFIYKYQNDPLAVEAQKKIDSIIAKKYSAKIIEAPKIKKIPIKKPVKTRLHFEPEMVEIPKGAFEMGSYDGLENEKPLHRVELSCYKIGKFQITLEQFKAFMDTGTHITDAEREGHSYTWKGNNWVKSTGVNWKCDNEGKIRPESEFNHPVTQVSWYDCDAYCNWLSQKTGKIYQLPTEAQWEYAAGNGNKHTKYSWGNGKPIEKNGGNVVDETKAKFFNWARNSDNIFLNYDTGYSGTSQVGSFNPNEFGLYDMTGNVWEWCLDWLDDNFYKTNKQKLDPCNTQKDVYRSLRGASLINYTTTCRVAYRFGNLPDYRSGYYGFRVCEIITQEK